MTMAQRFANTSVLITGAVGGIGRAIVKRFAEQGALIIAADADAEQLQQMMQDLGLADAQYHCIAGDLRNADYCNNLPKQAAALAGRLDVVVNNAGVMRRGDILNTSDDDWQLVMQVNVDAVFRVCRASVQQMQNTGGAIVNLASCWGIYPGPEHIAYCTSKAAVAALTKCLARDHAAQGIRVNAVCPNEVNTPMLRTGFELRGLEPDTAVAALNQTVPLGRIAEPDDIADCVAFLASHEARYVCGELLEVNGAKPVY